MLEPEEAIDRLAALMKAPPGHRVLHAKGLFCSGTFNASPEAAAICRAGHLQGGEIPVIVRWSHGSGRPDANDDAPYVRGMSVSFVLPDGKSTDLLGQTVPRFPVRTPEDFVRLSEVARDRARAAEVRGHPAAHGTGAGGQRAGEGAGPAEELRRGDVLPDPRLPMAVPVRARHLGALPAGARGHPAGPSAADSSRVATGCARRSAPGSPGDP